MTDTLNNLRMSLEKAVDLIDKSLLLPAEDKSILGVLGEGKHQLDFSQAASLLDKCDEVISRYTEEKPTIRIIHHLACSGGTLISKCICGLPNVYLLSEVHPFTDLAMGEAKPKYSPSDINSLTKYADIPQQKALAAKIFKKSIDEVYTHVTNLGGTLVIRDHTHSDFNTNVPIPDKSLIATLLAENYNIKSVLSIRNPIDSYTSLVKNNWVHFKPKTFDEYCKRLLLLIEQFEEYQILYYEDFIQNPQNQMRLITNILNLPFDEAFEGIFDIFKVTGGSGRTSDLITERTRQIDPQTLAEYENTASYIEFNKKTKGIY